MKIAILLVAVCLVSGSMAQGTGVIDNLKNTLKTTVETIKTHGTNALKQLLGHVTTTGTATLQNLLTDLLQKLATGGGKRDVEAVQAVRERLQKFIEAMKAKKAAAKEVMAKGLKKLEEVIKRISSLEFLKHPLLKTEKDIDEAVAHHHDVTRRFLGDLGKDLLETLKQTGLQLGQSLLNTVLGKLAGANLGKRFLGDIGKQLLETLKQTGQQLGQQLLAKVLGGLAGGKRALHPAIQGLVDFFKPHVQTVVGSVKDLANTLKGHATNLWNTVQTHAGALQTKLQGHVSTLKTHGQTLLGHGKTAVDALKAAVTDILAQTLTNAKGTIGAAGKTVGEAGKTITNHLINTINTAGSQ